MAVTITGIPERIARADYQRLIESVGFELDDLISLTFHANSIEATIAARDAEGHIYAEGGASNELAVHNISIPVED